MKHFGSDEHEIIWKCNRRVFVSASEFVDDKEYEEEEEETC